MKNQLREITVTYSRYKELFPTLITGSEEAVEVLRNAYSQDKAQIDLKEYFYILLLNRRNQLIGYHQLSVGGMTGTVADIRLAFALALKCGASGMILAHNHPSGSLAISKADEVLTQKFKSAGELLDIAILDHVVLTSEGYYGFADKGHL